ncbi:MAG: AAA family ATPase [Caulobacterales bacterium]
MQRFILTGTPGCGKTTIIHALAALGHAVVPEAATDVIAEQHARGIAEPHTHPGFTDSIVAVQRARQLAAADATGAVQFFDRSPVCTHALAVHLGHSIGSTLAAELARIEAEGVYQRRVAFIDNLGFVEPTAARRISFEDSLAFERVHKASYRAFGYELIRIPAAPVDERVRRVLAIALG